jgi:hypothetical protein
MSLINQIKKVAMFAKNNPIPSTVIIFLSCLVAVVFTSSKQPVLLNTAIGLVFIALGLFLFHETYRRASEKYHQALENDADWHVSVNGVDVGAIQKSTFRELKMEGIVSPEITFAFIAEGINVFLRLLGFFAKTFVVVLVFSIAMIVFDGQELTSTIAQAINESQLNDALKSLTIKDVIDLFLTVGLIASLIITVFKPNYFFRSTPYHDFISYAVRKHVGCPATGIVKVYSLKPDALIHADEVNSFECHVFEETK